MPWFDCMKCRAIIGFDFMIVLVALIDASVPSCYPSWVAFIGGKRAFSKFNLALANYFGLTPYYYISS